MRRKITKRKLGEVREDRTDWARVDAMTEKELERAIAADQDAIANGVTVESEIFYRRL